jgi:NADP-dependent 3-hydroxy acid dehydrogenase YdfG
LIWLGARVVVAEIDKTTGSIAQERLDSEFGPGKCLFVQTDVGEERDVAATVAAAKQRFGKVDAVLNNATLTPMGLVQERAIADWDRSYRVNLRGPVLLARECLPEMLAKGHGTIVCVSSSGAAPFMGAYEVFKTAQVELAATIAAECEGKGVHAFTIGPGIVATPGFMEGGGEVAKRMGITTEELLNMNRNALLTAEEAGAGFAAAIALAEKYHGKEVSSSQALMGIGALGTGNKVGNVNSVDLAAAAKVLRTFDEQAEGWSKRNLFERQWVSRDFRKNTGLSIDEMRAALKEISEGRGDMTNLKKLAGFYRHQEELLRGYEKDPAKVKAGVEAITSWIKDIELASK